MKVEELFESFKELIKLTLHEEVMEEVENQLEEIEVVTDEVIGLKGFVKEVFHEEFDEHLGKTKDVLERLSEVIDTRIEEKIRSPQQPWWITNKEAVMMIFSSKEVEEIITKKVHEALDNFFSKLLHPPLAEPVEKRLSLVDFMVTKKISNFRMIFKKEGYLQNDGQGMLPAVIFDKMKGYNQSGSGDCYKQFKDESCCLASLRDTYESLTEKEYEEIMKWRA